MGKQKPPAAKLKAYSHVEVCAVNAFLKAFGAVFVHSMALRGPAWRYLGLVTC